MAQKRKPVNRDGWSRYEYKQHGGDINYATRTELTRVVQRAAHVANERLRALERSDVKHGAYMMARSYLNVHNRTRFMEGNKSLANMTLSQLRTMYAELRGFLSAKTSTISGVKQVRENRYKTAVSRGFTGTESEWGLLVAKYFAKAREGLFSSDMVYNALTNQAGLKVDYLDTIIQKDQEAKARGDSGLSLSDALVAVAQIKVQNKSKGKNA